MCLGLFEIRQMAAYMLEYYGMGRGMVAEEIYGSNRNRGIQRVVQKY